MNNRIGIYFAYWTKEWDADFRYYIRKAARLGFDTLEICPAPLVNLPREACLAISQTAEEVGIDLTYCIGIPPCYDLASEDPAVRKAGIDYQKQLIDVMSAMGGTTIGGILYSCWPYSVAQGPVDKRPMWERSVMSMRQVASYAADHGVTLCMEVVNRFEQVLLNTAREAVLYCKEVDSPSCRILLDTFHMNIEEDDFASAIRTAAPYLAHMHIGETNRKTPGVGKMDWDTICGTLKEIDYRGHVVMEPFVKMGGTVGNDIRIWRDLSDNCDEKGLDNMAEAACRFIRGKLM